MTCRCDYPDEDSADLRKEAKLRRKKTSRLMNATVRITKLFVYEDNITDEKFILRPGRVVFGPGKVKWKDVKRIMKKGLAYSFGFGPMAFEIPPEHLELTIR